MASAILFFGCQVVDRARNLFEMADVVERVSIDSLVFHSAHFDAVTIEERKVFFGSKAQVGREGNPGAANLPKRHRQHYDSLFGEGRFASQFGQIEEPKTSLRRSLALGNVQLQSVKDVLDAE